MKNTHFGKESSQLFGFQDFEVVSKMRLASENKMISLWATGELKSKEFQNFYYTFTDLMSDIGGLLSTYSVIFALFAGSYNELLLKRALVDDLYYMRKK